MIARHSLQRLISDFQWLVVTANVLAFVFSIVGFFEFEHLLLDLPSHFRIQYFVIALISIPILIYIKRYKTVLLCLLTLASNFYAFSPYIGLIRSTPDGDGRKIRVLLANVNSKNERYADVLNMFRRINPDFLVWINSGWINSGTGFDYFWDRVTPLAPDNDANYQIASSFSFKPAT